MSIALASAWHPRGELSRFKNLITELEQVYVGMVISLPPEADTEVVRALQGVGHLQVVITPFWSGGRHLALEKALETSATHLHYVDFDRLVRWVETRPEEWRQTVAAIQEVDCLVVGRTEAAYRSHPQALYQTEAISNLVTSYLVGKPLDVSAGCKGFSRRAAEVLMANCTPGKAFGTDAEWLVLLKRAGFEIDTLAVDGLDWESADRFLERAADPQDQLQAAEVYDADPQNWFKRVRVAMEIIQSGLEAEERYLESTR
ncbi:MAG: hypothetical protein A2Z45_05485 [Chloroflexi bacterium RBG_19FT_COMBO_55_16]|nr:MAG: hypothetical protein A2Z45_05485 [Chloroflexi bacterium RBG_19FT_COMBO_55_16]